MQLAVWGLGFGVLPVGKGACGVDEVVQVWKLDTEWICDVMGPRTMDWCLLSNEMASRCCLMLGANSELVCKQRGLGDCKVLVSP